MTLTGWSLPLSSEGRAALVPAPPWHFSGDALGFDFTADPAAVAAVLPEGIEPLGDGSASFVFVDWASAAENDPRIAADPARGQYREAYLTVYGKVDGRTVARVPFIWVDNDLSLARGLIQGFPKKLGMVAVSKAVRVGRGGPRLEAGGRFAGHVSSLGVRLAAGSVTLAETVERPPRALARPVWHTRYVPDLAGGEPLVNDLARNLVTGFDIADHWAGPAELEFGESEFEELFPLRPIGPVRGFRVSVAFTITGAEVRRADGSQERRDDHEAAAVNR